MYTAPRSAEAYGPPSRNSGHSEVTEHESLRTEQVNAPCCGCGGERSGWTRAARARAAPSGSSSACRHRLRAAPPRSSASSTDGLEAARSTATVTARVTAGPEGALSIYTWTRTQRWALPAPRGHPGGSASPGPARRAAARCGPALRPVIPVTSAAFVRRRGRHAPGRHRAGGGG